jgi:branched-chain amino acid transport system ATP-binding protein/neutral amino acid transport system ATP-binding protein
MHPERSEGGSPLLHVTGLRRSFYGVQALTGADLRVGAGTITGLIGPNGAGKTTLFNCVSGLIPPEAGRVVFDGEDITGWRADRVTRRGLVRTFQIARGFPRLSVLENLMLYGAGQPGETLWRALARPPVVARREEALRARAFDVARRLNLMAVVNAPASDLSGGQKKLLELGRALMTDPKLVLLDEPIAGVNPTLAGEIARHLERLRDDGLTFLIIEHHLDVIARLCDPVVVLAEGRHLAEGSFAALAADARVQEAYMGRRMVGEPQPQAR